MHGHDLGTTIQIVTGIIGGVDEIVGKYRDAPSVDFAGTHSYSGFSLDIGGDQPHNNMSPYVVFNFWKKIAD